MAEEIELMGIKVRVAQWMEPNEFGIISRDERGYPIIQRGKIVAGDSGHDSKIVLSAPLRLRDFAFTREMLEAAMQSDFSPQNTQNT